tara:strand:- start:27543 stop:27671 length:129 start_codon:yes stop_codon:yes gene_type:complete
MEWKFYVSKILKKELLTILGLRVSFFTIVRKDFEEIDIEKEL